jgi:hypothetical protein
MIDFHITSASPQQRVYLGYAAGFASTLLGKTSSRRRRSCRGFSEGYSAVSESTKSYQQQRKSNSADGCVNQQKSDFLLL